MKQNELRTPEGARQDRKRVGRGYASGHGKTSGRGQKGQKARTGGNIRVGFEGGQNPLIYRMPFKRGFTNPFKKEYHILNVGDLEGLPANAELTPESLVDFGLVKPEKASVQEFRVKLLGDGEVTTAFTVRLHKVSAGARQKLEAVGGTVQELT